MLVDSHVHLHQYSDFAGLLDRAKAAGVDKVVAVGVDLDSSRWNVGIAAGRKDVIPAVGIHPLHVVGPLDGDDLADLDELAAAPVVRFIGEIGVDTIDSKIDLKPQIEALASLLAVAVRVNKPVNLHLRGDIGPALDLVNGSGIAEIGAVCHYFVGNTVEVSRLLDAGLVISVGKPVTRSENAALRQAIRYVPSDRLLVETDSYPIPGRSTEPADLPRVVAAIAEVRGCSPDAVKAGTSDLFKRLVGIDSI